LTYVNVKKKGMHISFNISSHTSTPHTPHSDTYPSPLNYYRFPKSVCTSVNEVGPCTTTKPTQPAS